MAQAVNKRLLVTSDIHGCYDEFMRLLEKVNYDPVSDQLLLLGDYIDRGPDSKKVVEEVIKLQKDGAICLFGNHEDMMVGSFIENEMQMHYMSVWLGNGGQKTLDSYGRVVSDTLIEHLNWMAALPLYYETEDLLFTHASPDVGIPIAEQRDALIWGRHFKPCGFGKLVVHGHTPQKQVKKVHDQLFVDTGGVFGQHFSIVELFDPPHYNVYTVDGYRVPQVVNE